MEHLPSLRLRRLRAIADDQRSPASPRPRRLPWRTVRDAQHDVARARVSVRV